MKAIALKRKDGARLPVNESPFLVYERSAEFFQHKSSEYLSYNDLEIIRTGLVVDLPSGLELKAEWAGFVDLDGNGDIRETRYPLSVEIMEGEICIICPSARTGFDEKLPIAKIRVVKKAEEVPFRFIEVDEKSGGRKMSGNSKRVYPVNKDKK